MERRFLETKANLCGTEGTLVLDDDCYTNFITPRAVEELRLPYVNRKSPYYDEGGYWVDKRVMVFISLGEYQEEVWCDVLPMDTCHVCLGGPWFQRHGIPHEQEWHKYVVDERRKPLFPYVQEPNVRWPILIMEASGEEYVKWEFMMEEIFASYPYSQ